MLCCVVWATQFDEEPFAEAFGKKCPKDPKETQKPPSRTSLRRPRLRHREASRAGAGRRPEAFGSGLGFRVYEFRGLGFRVYGFMGLGCTGLGFKALGLGLGFLRVILRAM